MGPNVDQSRKKDWLKDETSAKLTPTNSYAVTPSFQRFSTSTGNFSKLSYHCRTLPTKNAQLPQNVLRQACHCAQLLLSNPKAGHNVNPTPPTKFHAPIHHPSVFGAGFHHFDCVSSMKRVPEMMKPMPPRICGAQ